MAPIAVLLFAALISAVCGQKCYPDPSSTCIPAAQNAAYRGGKTKVSATSTCGSPRTGYSYCRIHPINGCGKCNASNPFPILNHDEKYMNDPRNGLTTWWQSETWWNWYKTNQEDPLQVNATLSFNKSFDIMGEVRIVFDSPRPFAMVLEKSTDKGQSWVPLQFYADSCQTRFGMSDSQTDQDMDENFNAVCTQEYSSIDPQRNGVVMFDFSKRYSKSNFWNRNVQNYLWATDIRIRMLYPGAAVAESANPTESNLKQFYYAISDITIASRCKCNGHAKWCDYPNESGKNCDCYHDTAGDDCEMCKPLYNNKPWRAASSESQPNPCEKCECHSHAEACEYNQTLNHGICQDCQHNTTGFFCEQCKDKFYRNAVTTLNDPNTCLSCGCFPYGITNNGSCNVTTGQCMCRQNVTGRQCDHCKDTFWGYQMEPVGHCRQCLCIQSGTINGNLSCSQSDGQCPCKPNIHQRRCTTCKDGYYDFPTEVGTGADCKQCDCDYGGSVQAICEKVNGTCLCHQNITGKRCTEVEPGYFVGFFTLLKFEAEYAEGNGIQTSYLEGFGGIFTGRGYSKLSHHQWVAFAVKLSVTFPFHAVLRYTSPQSSNASIQLQITASRTSNCTAFNTTHFLNPLAKGSGLAWKIQSPIGICKNQELIFNVTFIGEGHNSTVEVDSLLLIPDITRVRTYQIAQQSSNTLGYTLSTMEACAANSTTLTGSLSSLDICENVSFSVMAEAFTGALACKCDSTGTVNGTTCDPYGGQCRCKPGVTGHSCNQCKPGYFGFSQEGCKSCNCSDLGSDHLVCDVNTGQCPCKANVITRTCSRCNDTFYGFETGQGCVDCKCNASGSANMQCDGHSGKCPCKSSTTGDKCDRCKQNFFNFTSEGCQACHCHEGGSRSLQCDLQSGICSCKNNTVGMKCSSCVSGTFNVDVNNPDGCAPCYCYGRSNVCSSARFFTSSNISSVVHLNGNGNWQLTSSTSNTSIIDIGFKDQNGLRVTYSTGVWIVFTSPSDPFSKDLLASYGQQLVLEVEYTANLNINWTVELEPAVGSRVYFLVIPKPSQAVTAYSVRLHEDFATERLSAYQLQSKLANVKRVRIKMDAGGKGEFWFKSMTMETAQQSIGALDTVGHVENCSCPVNYTGLSCELCHSGYRREHPNRPVPSNKFVECSLCSCTSRSSECDPESGICRNCRLGSEGNHCERCQPNVNNRTDCTECYPGYYGLGMANFNGCEECDCVLGNTPYGNGSVCNMTNGQCECKPKIAGRRCDRCHENAVNTSTGCVDCPECYRLLQSEVVILRSEISVLQETVYRLKNGDIGDLPFAQQLNNSIEQIRLLTRKADNSSGVESGLYEELMKMNQTLNDLEKALQDTMESGIQTLESDTEMVHITTNSTKDVITLVNRLITQSYYILNGSVKAGLNEAEEFANFLSGKVSIIGNMANQSTFHARQQNRSGEVIVSRVDTAGKLVKEAVELSANAVEGHNRTIVMIEELRANASIVNRFGQQLRSFADQLYNNATVILNRTSEALDEIQGLSPDNSNTVKELLSAATTASNNATILITRTETLSERYANLTAEINKCRAIVEEVMAKVNTTDHAAGNTLRKATSARDQATVAIALADKTHSDSKEMLKILSEFVNQSRQAQQLAQQALTRVSEANKTSMDAIALAQQVHSTVQRAVQYASQSLSLATEARDLSRSENQNVSEIHTDAKNLEGRAVSSKYTEVYMENIKQNTTAKRSSSQHHADSCKSNYSRNAQDASTSASQAKIKSDRSDNSAKAARNTMNKLLSDISNLQTVNTTRLKELEAEITRLCTSFTSLDMQLINKEIKGVRDEQIRYIIEYRKKIQDISSQTRELKRLYDSLKSVPCN